MNTQVVNSNNKDLIQQLQSHPELLEEQPELFQKTVIELLESIDRRLMVMENRWMKPLIS